MSGGERGADRVVAADHLRPVDLAEVPVERRHDAVERSVVVEMVGLDVGEDRAVHGQLEVGAVALVGLDDQPVAVGPLRSRADVGDVTADDEARPKAGFGEDQHEHRRRRGLAVGAGNGERSGPGADRCQHAGAAQHGDTGGPRLVEFDVAFGDRRRRGDGVDAVHQRPVVADVHLDAGGTHSFEHGVLAQIRTGDDVSHLGQGDRHGAHTRPADADDVQPVGDREIERRARLGRRRHRGVGERVDRALQLVGEDR